MNVSGIANLLTLGAQKPCSTECVIQSLTAALEYDDGSAAVYSNKVRLHLISKKGESMLSNVGLAASRGLVECRPRGQRRRLPQWENRPWRIHGWADGA